MVAAIVPALLYFLTSFFMVHYRALKENLLPVPKDELPNLVEVIKNSVYYFTPLIILIILLAMQFSPSRSVFWALLSTVAISWTRKETRMGPREIYEALFSGVQKALELVAVCAVAGIIIGMVTMTGLGLKFSTLTELLAGGNLFAGLFYTLIASLNLGIGVPTTAKYIILATLVSPVLVTLGASLLASHLFILYVGTDADITPPVGLAAYAAAGLAGPTPCKRVSKLSRWVLPLKSSLSVSSWDRLSYCRAPCTK